MYTPLSPEHRDAPSAVVARELTTRDEAAATRASLWYEILLLLQDVFGPAGGWDPVPYWVGTSRYAPTAAARKEDPRASDILNLREAYDAGRFPAGWRPWPLAPKSGPTRDGVDDAQDA